MLRRRRQINGDPEGRARRLASAAGRAAAGTAGAALWPFERIAWTVERRALWPLQRRLAGVRPPGRRLGAAAGLVAVGLAAILVAVLILPGGGGAPRERVARPARVAIVPPSEPRPQAAEQQGPTLQGVRPHFGGGGGAKSAEGSPKGADAGGKGSGSDPAAASGGPAEARPTAAADAGGEGEAAATASATGKPAPAGPVAMRTARRFAEAFVFYEIGRKTERAKTVFGETATERLAEALEERPPRLPSNGRVPKAKVLNLVPGPRFGRQYTVSVSLLRVGATSELRITLRKEKAGEWRVVQVLG